MIKKKTANKRNRIEMRKITVRWIFAAFLLLNASAFTAVSAMGSSPGSSASSDRGIVLAQKDSTKPRTKSKSKKHRIRPGASVLSTPSATQRYLTLGIFTNLMILGIYGFWARMRDENAAPVILAEIPQTARPGFDIKAVKLQKIQGIDPHTVRADGASMIQPIGKFKMNHNFGAGRGAAVNSAEREADPDQDDISDDDTVAFVSEDLEPGSKQQFPAAAPMEESEEPALTSSAFKIKSLKGAADFLRKGPGIAAPEGTALFPPEIAMHYQAKPGEKLALTCDFKSPLYSAGTLVITNKRLLAVYQRHLFRLFLPQVSVENRRNSVRLRQIEEVSMTGSNRPLLLGIGAVSAWIPTIGVVISGVCVLGFFFWTRTELAVRMDNQILRTYPLRPSDMGRALHLIDRARQQLVSRQAKTPIMAPSPDFSPKAS